ncbi:MAG: hypothetical protein HQ575_07040, partial [Candidatus Omnitrophica bacterium]|nr:hypothetical protein [Candidatus Omnitrophota bacterium]
MIILFTKFILSAALILIFGFRLSKTAHSIVKMGRFTEGFMGVVLLAAITSFPEIFTSIASATYVDAINLGIGDLIGSVMLNLMVIAVLDFKYGKGALLSIVDKDLIASCAFSFIMLGLIMAALGLSVFTGKVIGIFNIGLESFLLIIIYLYIVTHSFKKTLSDSGEKGRRHEKEGKAFLVFALYGIIIIAGSFWLTSVSKDIVDKMGWNEMYFGTTVIALATSLPEIVVSMTALSIGSA